MVLPRFLRRKRLNWKILAFIALASTAIFVYMTYGLEMTQSVKDYLPERRKRFEKYKATEDDRKGPGEMGAPVVLEGEEKALADSLFKKEAFNIIASDKISLERSIKDVRDAK